MIHEIRGYHVLFIFISAFTTLIFVNLILAVNALRTFPGLEVENSYIASQKFEAERNAQQSLAWNLTAEVDDGRLFLKILENGRSIAPEIQEATFGRATSISEDQILNFTFENDVFWSPVIVGPGNWNLRLKAYSENGILFSQRLVVDVKS